MTGERTRPDGASPHEAFELLANPARFAVLEALWEADEPLGFSDLRRRAGIVDSGQFNYHLSKLAGHAFGTGGRLALTGGVAVFLVGSSVAHRVAPGCLSPGTFRVRLVGAAVVGLLGLLATGTSALALLGLTAAVLVGLIGYESLDTTPETADAGTDPHPRDATDATTGGRVAHEWAPTVDGGSRQQDHADLAD